MTTRRATAITWAIGAATALAALSTLTLRIAAAEVQWGGRSAWSAMLGATLGLLAIRIAVSITEARRGALRWSRLLLPGILWIEGAGVWWGDGAPHWQIARLATAIALELAFVVVAIYHLRTNLQGDELPETRITRPLEYLLPARVARLVALELVIVGSALGFLFGGWRRTSRGGFTYDRESLLRLLLPVLPLIAIGDIALLELVILPHAELWVRIVVHVIAIYGVVWVIGMWASFRTRPHRIHDGRAILHRGLLRHVEVPLDLIASINPLPSFSDDWKLRAYRKGAIAMDTPGPTALDIRLRAPIRPIGVLGPGRPSGHLIVAVDDPTAFIAALGFDRKSPTDR